MPPRNAKKNPPQADPNWQAFQPKRHGVRLNVAASATLDLCFRGHSRIFIRVAKHWRHIAGEAHQWTLPLAIKGRDGTRTLTIATDSAHALILHMLIPEIITRANQQLGYPAINRIAIDQSGTH